MDSNAVSCLEWYCSVRLVRWLLFLPPMRFPINTITLPGYAPNIDRIDQINYCERIKWVFDFTIAFVRASKIPFKRQQVISGPRPQQECVENEILAFGRRYFRLFMNFNVNDFCVRIWYCVRMRFRYRRRCIVSTKILCPPTSLFRECYTGSKEYRGEFSMNVFECSSNHYSDMKWIHWAKIRKQTFPSGRKCTSSFNSPSKCVHTSMRAKPLHFCSVPMGFAVVFHMQKVSTWYVVLDWWERRLLNPANRNRDDVFLFVASPHPLHPTIWIWFASSHTRYKYHHSTLYRVFILLKMVSYFNQSEIKNGFPIKSQC